MMSLTSIKKGDRSTSERSFPIDLDSLDALNRFLDAYFMITCLLDRQLHGLFFPSLTFSLPLSQSLCLSLQSLFAHLEVGQLDFGRISASRAGHEGWSLWQKTLNQTVDAQEASCPLLSTLLFGSVLRWGELLLLSEIKFLLLWGTEFFVLSPSSCDYKDRVCQAQGLVGHSAST